MGDLVTLRPVTEDDLSWLESLRDGPVAAGLHGWHGWSDPKRRRRQWAESGLLGDDGGMLIVLHDTDRVGDVSWRKVKTGPTAFSWAIGIGLAPEFRGRGYGSEAQRLLARYLFAHTQVNRIEPLRRSPTWLSSGLWRRPGSLARASCAAPRSTKGGGMTR
jgi:RimJ/RimL family protein N-acetyltransferase